MPRRDQRLLLGLAALTLAFALVQSATGISGDVLLAAPVLILLLPVLGTFPRNNAIVKNVRTASVRFGESVVAGLIDVKRANGSTVAVRTSGLQPSNKARLRASLPGGCPRAGTA